MVHRWPHPRHGNNFYSFLPCLWDPNLVFRWYTRINRVLFKTFKFFTESSFNSASRKTQSDLLCHLTDDTETFGNGFSCISGPRSWFGHTCFLRRHEQLRCFDAQGQSCRPNQRRSDQTYQFLDSQGRIAVCLISHQHTFKACLNKSLLEQDIALSSFREN